MQLPRCRAAEQTRRCWGVKATAGEDTHPALVPTGVVSHMQHQPVLMLPDTVSNACAGKRPHMQPRFCSKHLLLGVVRHACVGWCDMHVQAGRHMQPQALPLLTVAVT